MDQRYFALDSSRYEPFIMRSELISGIRDTRALHGEPIISDFLCSLSLAIYTVHVDACTK